MRKSIIAMLCLSGSICLPAAGQSAWKEICENPQLAAGKYYAYQAPETALTPSPEGYEPFYISTFARHGSRYLTKQKKYEEPLRVLAEAEKQHGLTADGKRALEIVKELAAEAEGRYGELTPKGAEQHRELIRRMYAAFPQIFTDGVHVDARSTYKTRAFLSMAAGCIELKGLNPRLVITTDASEHDSDFMKYKNPEYERLHLAGADSIYRLADSVYVHPERLMKQLFTHPATVEHPVKLMTDLFELDGICQSSYGPQHLSFLFTDRERYDLWQRNNFEWYYEKGASPLSGSCMYRLERNLLNNFIAAADTVIASGKKGATLRYGHDTNLAPLAVLMGINHLAKATDDWQQIAETYRTYRIIPMCGNIQLIFYRHPEKDDILVKLLLNEREVSLPIATDRAPYYHWKDVRNYWTQVVRSINLPECQKDTD